jgi:predicted DNA-binding transcriptional regulator AlpA
MRHFCFIRQPPSFFCDKMVVFLPKENFLIFSFLSLTMLDNSTIIANVVDRFTCMSCFHLFIALSQNAKLYWNHASGFSTSKPHLLALFGIAPTRCNNNKDCLLTVRDLEHLLQINKRSVPRLCQRGLLPMPLKLGGGNRWRACDIVAAIDRLDPKIGQKNECVEMNQ